MKDTQDPALRDAATRRMVNQQVWQPAAADAAGVVRSLVAMQAQEFAYALWSIAQRVAAPPSRDEMLRAFDDGAILRTHVLRPTWHFAVPEDIRWLLRLTAPKLRRTMAYYTRQEGLDAAELNRSQDVLASTVEGGRHCARKELAAALEAAGVSTGGMRLGFILMHAEYDEVLISGAMQGKQQTYAAFDERVPVGPDYDQDQALAELARRYVATRAPVTAKDLAVWASLTLVQARRGLHAIAAESHPAKSDAPSKQIEAVFGVKDRLECVVDDLDGMAVWSPADEPVPHRPASPTVDLIQGYDELVMSYLESRRVLAPKGVLPVPDRAVHLHIVLIDGALVGHWRHQLSGAGAVIEVQLHRSLSAGERVALNSAVTRYGRYLGVPATLAEPVLLA